MTGDVILCLLVFWPMAAALIAYLIGLNNEKARCYFADFAVIAECVIMVIMAIGVAGGNELEAAMPGVCGLGLNLKMDGFRGIYATVAAFMWMMSTIFTREYIDHSHGKNRYYMFILFTLGATAGVFLSADLFTTFVFFEMMSVASYTWVAHEETKGALRAASTYLAVAVIGGMVTLMGLFMLYDLTGTLMVAELHEKVMALWDGNQARIYVTGALILFGFMAKAGAYPIHIWLPKAHPVAPAPASALLSGILTKTGIFGALILAAEIFRHNGYWGFCMLIIGVATMVWGGIIALFSNDLKRTLACSSVSQIGFIFVGIGMQGLLGEENALAVRGTFLHMMNHSLIKLALFMAAGVVFMNIHKLDLNAVRGFGRKKPFLNFVFLMGALGVGGIPLWNGYVSKTLIHESIVEYIELIHEGAQPLTFAFASGHSAYALFKAIEWAFIITGGMTFAYMLKLYLCLFVEKNADAAVQAKMDGMTSYMNLESKIALGGAGIVMPILGFTPGLTMDKLADIAQEFMHGEPPAHAVHYFNFTNLKGGAMSIIAGILIYFIIVRCLTMRKAENGERVYINAMPEWFDLENSVYRPVILAILPTVFGFIFRCCDYLMDLIILFFRKTTHKSLELTKEKVHSERYVTNKRLDGETRTYVAATISFSLVMFAIGMMIAVLYLVF